MDAHDQHLFIVGAVKDSDMSAHRQGTGGAPEKVMFEFVRARLFETVNIAALRVHTGHDMADRAILPGRVHRLENNEKGIAVMRVKHLLERAHFFSPRRQLLSVIRLGMIEWFHAGREVAQMELAPRREAEFGRVQFHSDRKLSQNSTASTLPMGRSLRFRWQPEKIGS